VGMPRSACAQHPAGSPPLRVFAATRRSSTLAPVSDGECRRSLLTRPRWWTVIS
jgi:hypothetical protein